MSTSQQQLPLSKAKSKKEKEIILAQTGPRQLKERGSPEYCWQTAMHLRRVWEGHGLELDMWEKTLAEIQEHRAWEKIPTDKPYGSLDALLQDVIGCTLKEARDRIVERLDALRDEAVNPSKGVGAPTGNKNATKAEDKNNVDHINIVPKKESKGGTGSEYLLGRIKRDAEDQKHPERQTAARQALEDYVAGKHVSVRAAARAAGIIKPPRPENQVATWASKSADLALLADKLLDKVPKDRLVELMVMMIERLDVDSQRKLQEWVRLALEGT